MDIDEITFSVAVDGVTTTQTGLGSTPISGHPSAEIEVSATGTGVARALIIESGGISDLLLEHVEIGPSDRFDIQWAEELRVKDRGGTYEVSDYPYTPYKGDPNHPSASQMLLEKGAAYAWTIEAKGQEEHIPSPSEVDGQVISVLKLVLGHSGAQQVNTPYEMSEWMKQFYLISPGKDKNISAREDRGIGWHIRNYLETHINRGYDSSGPQLWGSLPWPETRSANHHYDSILWMLEQWLLTGDKETLRMALLCARHQCTQGFYWGHEIAKHRYLLRYEKGNCTGDFQTYPVWSHQFFKGAMFVAKITGDALLNDAMDKFLETAVAHPSEWNRRWGVRLVAGYWDNLWVGWLLTTNPELQAAAEASIKRTLDQLQPGEFYFPNEGNNPPTPVYSPWQDGWAYTSITNWLVFGGLLPSHHDWMRLVVQNTLQYFREAPEIHDNHLEFMPYEFRDGEYIYTSITHGMWWLHLINSLVPNYPEFIPHSARLTYTVLHPQHFGLDRNDLVNNGVRNQEGDTRRDFMNGAFGSANEKIWGALMQGMRPNTMWLAHNEFSDMGLV